MKKPLKETPRALGYRWPAEWEPHRATWLVWPHNEATWPGHFQQAERQFAGFVDAVVAYEPVELLATGSACDAATRMVRTTDRITVREICTNDSWIRDYGPIFLGGRKGLAPALVDFDYNAWGGKYLPCEDDRQVGRRIAQQTARRRFDVPLILEAGSIEGNGDGILLSTRSCLLNSNRNPLVRPSEIETLLEQFLGVDDIIWLAGEIPGDDTDGHIDQIGRFIARDVLALTDLPGSDMFQINRERVKRWAADHACRLEIIRLEAPAPRRQDGIWLPASYANFCFVNGAVLVPTFGRKTDDQACHTLQQCLPHRDIVPVPADELIFGLGALHCLSQHEPARSHDVNAT